MRSSAYEVRLEEIDVLARQNKSANGWRRLLMRTVTIAVAVGMALAASTGTAAAHNVGGPFYISVPFDGTWDKKSAAHPSYHPAPNGGDWGLDFYAPAGTNVYARVSAPIPLASPVLKILAVSGGCGAGTMVRVGVYTGGGSLLGWVSYSHLTNVPALSIGQTISSNTRVGTTSTWPYKQGCWEVRQADGVHTHIEAYNNHHYSCYTAYGSNTWLSGWAKLGWVGSEMTGTKQACPTGSWPYNSN